jgi:hypothetical protein
VRARVAFQPLCEVTVVAQAGSHPALGWCLPGGLARAPTLPQADAARAALPPCAARAAQPSTSSPAAPPPGAGR